MKKTLSIVSAALLALSAEAAIVLQEDFNYQAGAPLEGQGTPNAWTLSTNTNNQQTSSIALTVSATALTKEYYGEGTAAEGLGVDIPAGITLSDASKQRVVYKQFDTNASYKSGALYAAFLINVKEATSSTRDFFAFDGNTGTAQRGRLFVKKVGNGYQLGVTRAGTTPVWSETLEIGETYLAVMKYSLIEGEFNDEVTLYVNFPLGYDEYTAAVQAKGVTSTDFDNTTADPSQLKAVAIKQREAGSAVQLSHLRVATTWEEATNYTGPAIDPDDMDKPILLLAEGFDTNGNWTVSGAGASTAKNHGDYGTTSRCLSFNLTADNDRCNGSKVISPAVNTAGVLRFFVTGSANETRGNIRVSKIINTDTIEIAYIEGPFNKEWAEQVILVREEASAVKIMLQVSDCGLGAGTIYIDDISLTNFVKGELPSISDISISVAFPSPTRPTAVSAKVTSTNRNIAEAVLLWGYSPATTEGRLAMRKTDVDTYTSAPIPAEQLGDVYYRVIGFDSYYVSDTTQAQSFKVYKAHTTRLTPNVNLAGGVEWLFEQSFEGVRIEFASANSNEQVQLTVIDTEGNTNVYSGTGTATTDELTLVAEPGKNITLKNTGSNALIITAIEYDPFRQLVFTKQPQNLQLYPRDDNNKAIVSIEGVAQQSDLSQLTLKMYRNGTEQDSKTLNITAGQPFVAQFTINAEPADYRFTYTTNLNGQETTIADNVVAGDVFVIAGQSNGAAAASGNPNVTNQYWRNFGCVQKTEPYNPADTTWGLSNSAGWGYGRQYYNGYSGYVLQRDLLESQQMPTAVLNIAIGGSSLNQNMPNEENHEDLNTFYGEGLYRLRKAGLADKVKAIIWVQGESDQNGLYEDYGVRLEKLYQSWKEDYKGLEHIYISQINVGCGTSVYASEIREVQRQMMYKHDDITVITNIGITIRYDSCHYVDEGYDRLYGQYARLIEQDFYGKTFDKPLTSPNVERVAWVNEQHTAIAITFDQPIVWPEPMWGRDMKDYFYDENDNAILVSKGYTDPADRYSVILELQAGQAPTHLTYGPDNYVYSSSRGMDTLYVDPWLRNDEGFAALTFNRYPIAEYNITAYNAIDQENFLFIENDMLIVKTTCAVDSIDIYSPTGKLLAHTDNESCNLRNISQGIYAALIRLKNGNTLSTKFAY